MTIEQKLFEILFDVIFNNDEQFNIGESLCRRAARRQMEFLKEVGVENIELSVKEL